MVDGRIRPPGPAVRGCPSRVSVVSGALGPMGMVTPARRARVGLRRRGESAGSAVA